MGRREVTSAVTMLVLIGLVVLGAAWGWQSLFATPPGSETAAEPGPTCTTQRIKPGQPIRSRQVTVSVFNGGTRTGLAGQTLDALSGRGFRAGEAGNAPSDVEVARVQVWSTIENDVEARLVARQFGAKVKVRFVDEDLGPGVDVLVGNDYKQLAKAPRALRFRQPQSVCVPVESSEPVL